MKPSLTRAFRVRGLERDTGRAVLEIDGEARYAIDVEAGQAMLTSAVEGAARTVATFDSQQTLDGIVEGTVHPIVAALQGRVRVPRGDPRFALSVLLGLRASAPVFAQRRS